MDDYAVDEVERNDESFVFVLDLDGMSGRLRLYPTMIRDCQARLANRVEAEIIASKMLRLCTRLGTSAQWNAQRKLLQVEFTWQAKG